MDCQSCGKNKANVHIVQDVGGKHNEFFLCGECSKHYNNGGFGFSLGLEDGMTIDLKNFLPGFIGHSNVLENQKQTLSCEVCGLSFDEFREIGKLGCGNCYATFYERLAPVISRIHGNVGYKGKIPSLGVSKKTKDFVSLQNLKEDLKNVIAREEYEQAAIIRDKIKEIEGQKGG